MKMESKSVQDVPNAQEDMNCKPNVVDTATQFVNHVLPVGTMTSKEVDVSSVADASPVNISTVSAKQHVTQNVVNVRKACIRLSQMRRHVYHVSDADTKRKLFPNAVMTRTQFVENAALVILGCLLQVVAFNVRLVLRRYNNTLYQSVEIDLGYTIPIYAGLVHIASASISTKVAKKWT